MKNNTHPIRKSNSNKVKTTRKKPNIGSKSLNLINSKKVSTLISTSKNVDNLKDSIITMYNSSQANFSSQEKKQIQSVISNLDTGTLRVAEKIDGKWNVNEWVKMAILLYFKIQKIEPIKAGDLSFFDKIPLKKWSEKEQVRVVPHALVRKGAFINKGAILMPSYTNIGAYVDSSTMIDTWATVGSCAQVGKNVHISGGVGIGGVLEPLQASPVIIEDNCFIGSRCIIVEGAVIESGAVLGAGVTITASTKIIDVTGNTAVELKGRIPAYSVVIPGAYAKKFPAGEFQVPCALIIGKRSQSTDMKTSLTQVLRDYKVSV